LEEILKKCCSRGENCVDPKGPTLPADCFSKRSLSPDGLSYSCKLCERATSKKSYQKRKKQRRERKYYEANKEKVRERSHKRYEENKEMILAQSSEYRKENKEVWRQADVRRRERLKKAEKAPYTRTEIIERDSEDGIPICQICMKPVTMMADLQIDHIVPLQAGGSDTPENVRVAHANCNRRRPKDGSDITSIQEG